MPRRAGRPSRCERLSIPHATRQTHDHGGQDLRRVSRHAPARRIRVAVRVSRRKLAATINNANDTPKLPAPSGEKCKLCWVMTGMILSGAIQCHRAECPTVLRKRRNGYERRS